jgi:hypothetical protein
MVAPNVFAWSSVFFVAFATAGVLQIVFAERMASWVMTAGLPKYVMVAARLLGLLPESAEDMKKGSNLSGKPVTGMAAPKHKALLILYFRILGSCGIALALAVAVTIVVLVST